MQIGDRGIAKLCLDAIGRFELCNISAHFRSVIGNTYNSVDFPVPAVNSQLLVQYL